MEHCLKSVNKKIAKNENNNSYPHLPIINPLPFMSLKKHMFTPDA